MHAISCAGQAWGSIPASQLSGITVPLKTTVHTAFPLNHLETFFFRFILLYLMRMICLHVYVHRVHAVPLGTSRGRQIPLRTKVTDGCELHSGCWRLNWGPLQEQSVLFTTERSLQLLLGTFQVYRKG